jgi:exonuclease VII small subunit
MTQEQFEQKYAELVNDRISTGVIQDEIWRYHPNNPNAIKVEEAYAELEQIATDLDNEISALQEEFDNQES